MLETTTYPRLLLAFTTLRLPFATVTLGRNAHRMHAHILLYHIKLTCTTHLWMWSALLRIPVRRVCITCGASMYIVH